MRLYTSYYARAVRASDDILFIRVSNTVPDWFRRTYHTLSINVFPDWNFINAFKKDEISYETFCAEYRKKIMGSTQPNLILDEIKRLADEYGKDTVVLLCYEKNSSLCHRTELARIIDDGCYCGEL